MRTLVAGVNGDRNFLFYFNNLIVSDQCIFLTLMHVHVCSTTTHQIHIYMNLITQSYK